MTIIYTMCEHNILWMYTIFVFCHWIEFILMWVHLKISWYITLYWYRQISFKPLFLGSYSGPQNKYFLCTLNIVFLITILSLFVEGYAKWNKSKSNTLKKPCFGFQNRGFRKNPPKKGQDIFLLRTLVEETWSVWFDY